VSAGSLLRVAKLHLEAVAVEAEAVAEELAAEAG